jgi:hypothetical protein
MRLLNLFVLLIVVVSCQAIKVKENTFKATDSNIELGALGDAKSIAGLKNNFTITAYPKIEEKIKLEVAIVPFTKKANKIYQSKARFNQKQSAINYVDSLPIKPEMVSIKISDIANLVTELNTEKNKESFSFIKNNERTSMITSVLVSLSPVEIDKLRQADTYYLVQTDVSKYNIALYKSGKKMETVDISTATILGYGVGKFCWFENDRGKWQIGDIIEKGCSCKGNTFKKVKPKKEKSLYKM